jgi:hypothetical protein
MAITIDHSNIASALGLAARAGAADRFKTVQQGDLQFASLMQNAQAEADRNYANQIQLALTDKYHNRELDLKAADQNRREDHEAARRYEVDRQYDLNLAGAQALNANRGASQGVAQQRLGIEQAHQQTREDGQDLRQQKFDLSQEAIDSLPPEVRNIVQATGRLPYIPSTIGADTEGKELETEYGRIGKAILAAQKAQQAASYSNDPKYLFDARGKQSQKVPGAAAGLEDQYRQAQQQIQAFQQRAAAIDASLNQRTQSLLGGTNTQGQTAASNVLKYIGAISGVQNQPPAQQPSAAPPSSSGAPTVSTAAEYAALPQGATYVWAGDGRTYVKR